ncbi:MAG: hypothetical protein MSH32_05790 [Lachnospiraceae bacterium]|nr:hypothetical protein [Lachnospiraceae bacterium]
MIIYDENTEKELDYDESMELVNAGKATLTTVYKSRDEIVNPDAVLPEERFKHVYETCTYLHKFSEDEISFEKSRKEIFTQNEAAPTNSELSDSTAELGQGVSNNEDALVELGEYTASLENMIRELQTKISALEGKSNG